MALQKHKIIQDDLFDRGASNQPEAEIIAMPPVELPPPIDRQPQQHTMRIGEILKRERERKGHDLQQIADYLCIRRGLLAAIEDSRYDELPADAYVIGFLRSYANLIGLDGQEAINYYRQEMVGRRKKPDLVVPTPISEGRAPTAVIMGAAAIASLLVYIVWYAVSTTDRTSVSTPPVVTTAEETASPTVTSTTASLSETQAAAPAPGIEISAPAPAQKTMSAAPSAPTETPATSAPTPIAPLAATPSTPTTTAAPAQASHITIKATQSSWVLVADSKGQTVYDHVMKPGEIYQVPDTPGLTLTTGNSAGILLSLDGHTLPLLSKTVSHMMRNIPLEATSLKALPQKPTQ